MQEEKKKVIAECQICFKEEVSVVILPCKHLCICEECSDEGFGSEVCPACNMSVINHMKIFHVCQSMFLKLLSVLFFTLQFYLLGS